MVHASLHPPWNFDLSPLPILMRNPIPRANTLLIPSRPPHILNTDILEAELPAPAFRINLRDRALFLLAFLLLMQLLPESLFTNLFPHLVDSFLGDHAFVLPFHELDEFRVGDSLVGGEEAGEEDFACIFAGEGAGFGDWVKDLRESCFVDGEIVYGLVIGVWVWRRRIEWRFREHAEDCAGIWSSEWFSLLYN